MASTESRPNRCPLSTQLLQLEDAGVHVQLQPQLRGALRRPQRPPLQEQEGPEDPECGPAGRLLPLLLLLLLLSCSVFDPQGDKWLC